VSRLAAAGRAPLGMRLRMLLLLPDCWMTTASSGEDWAGGVETSVAVDMVDMVVAVVNCVADANGAAVILLTIGSD
jgi:hypothetical protein